MATLIKEFNFVTDDEGWLANTSELNIDTGWFHPHKGHGHAGGGSGNGGANYPILSDMGGSYRFTAKQNTSQSKNYMFLVRTWEDLGVPAGATVTNVQGDYLYKWDLDYSGTANKDKNHAEFGAGDTNIGPFVLYDDHNVAIDYFSYENYAIDRGPSYGASYWKNYPTDAPVYPITFTPPGWGQCIGANISVPLAQQSSNSILFFVLRNITPTTAPWTYGDAMMWVRLKIDHIVLTITYDLPSSAKYLSMKRGNRLTFTNNSNNIILK